MVEWTGAKYGAQGRQKVYTNNNAPGALIDGILHIKNLESFLLLLRFYLGLPWWRSGWESACRCRRRGFMPRSGKIPHAVERLGP